MKTVRQLGWMAGAAVALTLLLGQAANAGIGSVGDKSFDHVRLPDGTDLHALPDGRFAINRPDGFGREFANFPDFFKALQDLGLISVSHLPAALRLPSEQAAESGSGSAPGHDAFQRMGLDRKTQASLLASVPADKVPLIALIDTGVDLDHPALKGQLWRDEKEKDPVHGYDFYGKSPNIQDTHGHGTYVAGVIAARPDDKGRGGINPKARLMILKASDKKGLMWNWSVADAIAYAVDHGAKIIHISAALSPPTPLEAATVLYALGKGCLVITPANSHSRNTEQISPSCFPGVLVVGALGKGDERLPSSGWGEHLDLMAPGKDILGLRAKGTDFLAFMEGKDPVKQPSGAIVDDTWYSCDGCCAAAPLVTGLASLLWAKHPEWKAQDVAKRLIMSCDDIDQPGWDLRTGHGKISAAKLFDDKPVPFLAAKIAGVKLREEQGNRMLDVRGSVGADDLKSWKLEVAYGRGADAKEWQTVLTATKAPEKEVLGHVPMLLLDRRGGWSIRCVAEDKKGQTRQSVVTVKVE